MQALSITRRLLASVTVTSLLLGAQPALAQNDDDLLGGLGDDDAPAEEPEAAPAEQPGAAPAAPEVDADVPLDQIEAAPPSEPAAPAEEEAAEPEEDEAEERAFDPAGLDRVKAVQRKPVLKHLRFEIAPTFSVSVNDSFYTHLSVGGAVVFYPHDNFGIGLNGYYMFQHVRSPNHDVIRVGQTAVPAVFAHPTGGGGVDLHWVPIYGKVSLFDSLIVPFDLYAVAGVGMVSVGPAIRATFRAGIGQRWLTNDWLAVRIELTDTVFNDVQQVNGQPRSDLQNYIMLNAGVSFFVPPSFEYSGL